MSEDMKRRVVGIAVLLAVFTLIAWWIGSRDEQSDELPSATAQVRNYDVRDLDRIANAQKAQQPVAEPVLEPGEGIVYETVETTEAQDSSAEPAAEVAAGPAPDAVIEKPAAPSEKAAAPQGEESQPPATTEAPKTAPKPVTAKDDRPATSAKGEWIVQVASVTQESNANTLAQKLQKSGWTSFVVSAAVNGQTYYRVRVGPYTTREQADKAASGLKKELSQNVAVMKR